VVRRLEEFRQRIANGRARFEDLARQYSEDGSAPGGGDLGWASPGQFVPEFEQVMQSLAINEVSAPVISRFGVHLIQVLERKQVSLDVRQQREAAKAALREQKYEETYLEWAREVRARAYVELREPPGL
jgi:peptidyl-prolyl cis-trans isomerase SurA